VARLTDDIRKLILADYHVGISQRQLALDYDVSPATINKLCKGIEPKNTDKVNTLVAVNMELSSQSEREVNAIIREVNAEVAFRLKNDKDLQAIQDKVNEMAFSIDSPSAALALMSATVKHREARLGKGAEVAVQVNNNITAIERRIIDVHPDD
jgi:flagellar capping protein FliD